MKYLKIFEKFDKKQPILIIVDVQKSFNKFFTEDYVNALMDYSKNFDNVYQIWDNHFLGKNPDVEYLYDKDVEQKKHDDLYKFPNQKKSIEKRYTYDVDSNFFKKILDKETFAKIKSSEDNLQKGNYFETTEGTIIVYIGNNHNWFHVPKKLYQLFLELKQSQDEGRNKIVIVGGASSECLEDITTTAKSLGLDITQNKDFIYSAKHCPI